MCDAKTVLICLKTKHCLQPRKRRIQLMHGLPDQCMAAPTISFFMWVCHYEKCRPIKHCRCKRIVLCLIVTLYSICLTLQPRTTQCWKILRKPATVYAEHTIHFSLTLVCTCNGSDSNATPSTNKCFVWPLPVPWRIPILTKDLLTVSIIVNLHVFVSLYSCVCFVCVRVCVV